MLKKRTPRVLSAAVVLAAGFALLPRTAWAGSEDLWPLPESMQTERPASRRGELTGTFVLHGHLSVIAGSLDSTIPVGYQDLFGSGVGLSGEGSLLWRSGEWQLGGYVSIGWDTFPGKTDTDDFGDTLKADGMDIVTVLAGFKGVNDFGYGFQADLHVGMGAAMYSSVDGTLTLSGVPMQVEVFKSSSAFVVDFGARFLYGVDRLLFDLGLDVRLQGPPRNGDIDFDANGPVVATLELGIGLKF